MNAVVLGSLTMPNVEIRGECYSIVNWSPRDLIKLANTGVSHAESELPSLVIPALPFVSTLLFGIGLALSSSSFISARTKAFRQVIRLPVSYLPRSCPILGIFSDVVRSICSPLRLFDASATWPEGCSFPRFGSESSVQTPMTPSLLPVTTNGARAVFCSP